MPKLPGYIVADFVNPTLRGVRLCGRRLHVYAAYLPRCPWCPPFPKPKGA